MTAQVRFKKVFFCDSSLEFWFGNMVKNFVNGIIRNMAMKKMGL